MNTNTSTTYDLIADQYDQSFDLLPVRRHIEAYSVLRRVGELRGRSALDVACGTGFYARALQRVGAAPVVGIDLSPEMIRVAQDIEAAERKSRPGEPGIEYHVGDASQLATLGAFDLVLGIHLLHYAPSREALFAMCAGIGRNLKPGGRFVGFVLDAELPRDSDYYQEEGFYPRIPEPHGDGAPLYFSIRIGGFAMPELTIYRWSQPTLTAALTAAGLTDLRWPAVEVSPQGVEQYGSERWARYLAHPHCLLVEATKA